MLACFKLMRGLFTLTLLLASTAVRAEPIRLAIDGGALVELDIDVHGKPPAALWTPFLDAYFTHFDRNRDGKLDKAEVNRMFPLPLPNRKELKLDFAALDADKNGVVTLAELTAYCESHGFGPIVVQFEAPSAEDIRLAEFFRLKAPVRRFRDFLDRFDLNEDERLDLSEIPPALATTPRPALAIQRATLDAAAGPRLRIHLGSDNAQLSEDATKRLALDKDDDVPSTFRLRSRDGNGCVLGFPALRAAPDMSVQRDFLSAQFKSALGDEPALTRAAVDDDPTLSGLQALFAYADHDGDNRLTEVELDGYLQLIERGMQAQIWIKVSDHAQNPFPILDANADGKLDVRELSRGERSLSGDDMALAATPRCYRITFSAPTSPAFGGVAIPAGAWQTRTALKPMPAPAWFTAMDRNRDGWISPREFLGPPELFRKLDNDRDGLISRAEANKAER